MWADTKHLLNQYSEAINIIDDLIACENLNEQHLCKLYWMRAHCLRHQWKKPSESLSFYEKCNDLSRKNDDKEYIIRSIHGMICIAFITNNFEFDFNRNFSKLEHIYSETDEKWNIYMYNTLKYKAIYERIINRNKNNAKKFLQDALDGYIHIKRRNIYDVYFEFGELYRFFRENEMALFYYNKCYGFARNNQDYNLESLAQMGIILSRIASAQKVTKSSILEELQTISFTAEKKELFLNKYYSKLLIENINNKNEQLSNILLFNP